MGAEFSLEYASDPGASNNNEFTSTSKQQQSTGQDPGGKVNGSLPENEGNQFRQPQPKYYNVEDIVNSDMDTMVDVTDKEPCAIATSSDIGRKIAVVRHAESMNEAFPRWFSSCVSQDHYTPKDLNHPVRLPIRSKGLSSYNVDPPITRLAKHASRILGKALAKDTSIKWDSVISAPELASTQTAAAIAFSTTGDKSFITVDETLYDFSHGKMDFMTAMELMKFDITVKVSNPIKSKEVTDNSISRVLGEFDKVQHQFRGNLIIVVGPATFHAVVQRFIGSDRSKTKKRPSIPQLACVILEKGPQSWKLYNKQVLPIRNNSNTTVMFDPVSYYRE